MGSQRRADQHRGKGLAGGASVEIVAGSSIVGAKSVTAQADDVAVNGSIAVAGKITLTSKAGLVVGQDVKLSTPSAIKLTAGGALKLLGSAYNAASLVVKTGQLSTAASSEIVGVGKVELAVTGAKGATLGGQVSGAEQFVLASKVLQMTAGSNISTSAQFALLVTGDVVVGGGVSDNKSVLVQTGNFTIKASASLVSNTSCAISGTKQVGSLDPAPCIALP